MFNYTCLHAQCIPYYGILGFCVQVVAHCSGTATRLKGLARVLRLRLTKVQKHVAEYSLPHSPNLGETKEQGRLSQYKVQECARSELISAFSHANVSIRSV